MTENNSPERRQPTGSPQNAGSKRAGIRNKIGRVSQRRELAAVTLGAVAAITGLGGVLAANPPSWATTAANAQSSITTQATTSSQSAPARESTIRVASDTKNKESASAKEASKKAQAQKTAQAAAQQAAQQAAPVYSAPTQAPAGAVSQGS